MVKPKAPHADLADIPKAAPSCEIGTG